MNIRRKFYKKIHLKDVLALIFIVIYCALWCCYFCMVSSLGTIWDLMKLLEFFLVMSIFLK